MFLYLSTIFISPNNNVLTEIRSSTIFLVTGFAMSPILRTLTETVSTDTIYAMVTLMMLAHLSFYHYGINAAIVSKPVSLNAAFFASVCLASRLSTSYHAFAFLIFAIDIFVLFGILYTKIPRVAKTVMTFVFAVVSLVMLLFIYSLLHCCLFLFLILFINIFCPYGFYKMQAYKENIYGPWDEAIIDRSNFVYLNGFSQVNSPMTPTTPTLMPHQQYQLRQNGNATFTYDLWTKLKPTK
ncbi:hypothetical protein TYRP_019327 [Tyrophagus putrescentiae]|nr:hypothetical protein TYRP_019327 [Tyrophagus putrescentiae]